MSEKDKEYSTFDYWLALIFLLGCAGIVLFLFLLMVGLVLRVFGVTH